jgi:magnesium transporter
MPIRIEPDASRESMASARVLSGACFSIREITVETSSRDGLETAAEHLTANVPLAARSASAGEVRSSLQGRSFDSATDVAVVEDGRLLGLVPIERLLAAGGDVEIAELMDPDPPVVGPGVDQERAAWRMVAHGESSLAVVDEEGRFRGLIPPVRMLAVLLAEHEEDVARLGGYLAGTERARTASEERVGKRLWHRLPWLLLGLAGAMVAAAIVGAFEDELREEVLLVLFVPGVVYMADAVGTQTEAVVIRGLAVGVDFHRVVWRELLTGAAIGLVIAVLFVPLAWAIWGDAAVAVAVALALWAACATATCIAMGLPYLLHALGRDPAFGSGPLATVVQDLLSIAIYFAITVPLVL